MKTGKRSLCARLAAGVALLCLLLPASVQASEKTGIYVTPKFTANFMNWQPRGDASAESTTIVTSGISAKGAGSFDFSSGKTSTLWGGALALGYDFYPRFDLPLRLELEYGMYSNTSGSTDFTLSPGQIDQILGRNNSLLAGRMACVQEMDIKLKDIKTLLFNVYYDFHNSTNFTPYIGAGAGLAFIQTQGSALVQLHGAGGAYNSVHYRDLGTRNNTNFAWQVGAGCSYAFTDTIALDLGYRFMGLGRAETNSISIMDVNHQSSGGGFTCVVPIHGKGEARDIYMHQINLGLRISF